MTVLDRSRLRRWRGVGVVVSGHRSLPASRVREFSQQRSWVLAFRGRTLIVPHPLSVCLACLNEVSTSVVSFSLHPTTKLLRCCGAATSYSLRTNVAPHAVLSEYFITALPSQLGLGQMAQSSLVTLVMVRSIYINQTALQVGCLSARQACNPFVRQTMTRHHQSMAA